MSTSPLITATTTTLMTTTTTQPKSPCWPNPCENDGVCRLSQNKEFYTCFCKSSFSGKILTSCAFASVVN